MAKILLVEDNEMNRDMLSRRLVKCGHEVGVACYSACNKDTCRSKRGVGQ